MKISLEKSYTTSGKHAGVVKAVLLVCFILSAFVARSQNTGFFNEYIPNLQQYSQQTMYINNPNMIIGGNMFAVTTQAATVMETDTNGNFERMWMLTAPSIELYRCRAQDANDCIVTGTMGSSCGVSGDGFIGSFNYTTGTWNGGYNYNDMAQLGGFCNGLCTFTDGIGLANGDIGAVGNMDQTVTCCLGASTLGTYNCGAPIGSGGVGYLDMFFGTGSYERGNDICLIRAGANGDTATASGGDGFVKKYSLAYSGGVGCGYPGPVQPTPVAHTTGTFNYISNPSWVGDSTRQDYPQSVVEDANHNMFICGYTYNYSSNNDYEGFILKVNSSGATQWCHTFYLNATATAYEEIINMAFVTEDGSNDIICTMQSYQSDNTELMRVSNATGNIVWANSYSFGTQTWPWGIHLTTNKTPITGYNEYLVGVIGVNFPGAPGSYDMAMLVIDDKGNLLSEIGEGMNPQDGPNYSPDVDQAGTGSYFISQNTPYTGGNNNGSLVAKINRLYNSTGCATYQFPVTATVTPRSLITGNPVICRVPVIYEVRGGATMTAITPTVSAVTAFAPTINCMCAAVSVSASATTPTICNGGNTNITASGATTYSWSPSTGLSATTGATVNAAPGSTTTYTVTGSGAAGCTPGTATVTVTVSPAPSVVITPGGSTTFCSGGSVTLTASGAGVGGTYSWSPATGLSATNTASVTANPTSSQTYTVTGTNSAGCPGTQTVAVTVNATPTISVSATSPTICSGNTDVLNAIGATTYSWTPATGLSATTGSPVTASPPIGTTTYTITGTTGGCTSGPQTLSITVNVTPTITASATSSSICAGGSTSLSASGATTYDWSPAAGLSATTGTPVTASPASSTTYSVTGTTNGCTSAPITLPITVNPNPTITITPTGSTTLCSGSSVLLTASGAGVGGTYSWSPAGGLSATNTAAVTATPGSTTTYTVTGTTSSGCSATQQVTVTVNPNPTITITPGGPTTFCSGGSVILTASGAGVGGTYSWSPATGLSATNTAAVTATPGGTTTYTVTGTNTNGCSATQQVTVTINPNPTITITPGGATTFCNGGNVTLTASGAGVGGTYSWSPAAGLSATNTAVVTATPASTTTYTVTGTNTNGCSNTQTVTVTVNPNPTIVITPGGPTTFCNGGSVALTASGAGVGGAYSWSPAAGLSATNTAAVTANPASTTTYTVTGTTSAGCSNTQTVTITVNPNPTIIITPGGPTTFCSGSSVSLTASGAGVGGTYSWSPAAGLSATNTAAVTANPGSTTTYTVTGTTSSGCSATQTVTITVNPTPAVVITPGGPTSFCSGGSVTLTASGAGVGGTYSWSPGTGLSATNTASVTATPGSTTTYTVTGTTSSGCSATQTVLISITPTPTVTVGPAAPAICPGGNVSLTASGGTTYTWSPSTGLSATTGATVTANPATTTTYTVTGTNGACTSTQTVTVTVAATLNVTVTPAVPAVCNGSSITLNANGAAVYNWKPATGLSCTTCPSPNATIVSTTTYTVVGTSGGCSDSANVTVTVNPLPTITITPGGPTTYCTGSSVSLTAGGAGAGGTYSWSPATGLSATTGATVTANPTSTTTYTVTGTTSAGCVGTQTVTITVNPLPTVSIIITGISPAICGGDTIGIIASGAGAGGTYTWSPAAGLNMTTGSYVIASPAGTTTYTVTGTNSNGCSNTATMTINVFPTPTVTVTPPSSSLCSGNNVGLTASGAATYTWSPGAGLSATTGASVTANPGSTTTYTVVGTAAGGCKDTVNTTITITPTPTVTVAPSAPTICPGGNVNLIASGAATYTWSPAAGLSATTGATVTANPVATTTYTVTGDNGGGCTSTQTVTVTVASSLSVTVTPPAPALCTGSSMALSANGAAVYSWSPATGLSCTNCPNPIVTITSATTYTVVGSSGTCTDSAIVTVAVNPVPTVTVAPPAPSVCQGSNVGLTASGATTYSWTPATGLSATTGSGVTATPASNTTYTVVGTNGSGCTDTTTITISVNTPPVITAAITGISSSICAGDTMGMIANGAGVGGTYTWSPSTGLSVTTGSYVIATPGSTTTYTVTGTNANGCSSTDSVLISVFPSPTVTVTPSATSVCSGDSVTLTASGANTYSWSPSTGLNTTTGAVVNAGPGSTITYTVVGTNGGGCIAKDSVTVTVTPTPTVTVTPPSAGICTGDSVTLVASGGTTYSWSPSTGLNVTTGDSVLAIPATNTTYTVTAMNGACSATASVPITVGSLVVTATAVSPTICSGTSTNITATGAVNYTWSPATGLSATTGNTVTANPAVTTVYSIVGSSGANCKDSTTITITVNPTPTVSIAPASPSICNGDSVALSASGVTTYSWSPSTGLSCSNCPNPEATPGTSTTYVVTGTTGGCSSTASVSINVGNITVTATAVTPAICAGGSSVINAGGGATYTWSPAAGLSATTGASVTANPAGTTIYTVIGTSAAGCIDSAKVTITVNALPTITASASNPTVCAGNATILTASGASTYTWTPATDLSATTGSPVTATPAVSLTYTVYGTSAAGCMDSAMVSITVNPNPVLNIVLSGSDSLCPGQSLTMTAGGATNYTWSPATGLSATTGASVTALPSTSPVIYTVVGSNGTCSDSLTQAVYLYPPLTVGMLGDSVCAGKNAVVTLLVSGGKSSYIYNWSNGLGSGPGPVTVTTGAGYYSCTVTDGCGTIIKDSALVFNFVSPKALFTPVPDTALTGQFVSFVNLSTGATSYFWNLGNGTTSTDSTLYTQYDLPGEYVVYLIASNGGCRDSVADTIYVVQKIMIPNVFTPNGDGYNDVFHVTVSGFKAYSIEIYNRWGERLFQTDSPNIDWTGRSMSGVEESTGTYYYVIKLTDETGKQTTYDGPLQLIRE